MWITTGKIVRELKVASEPEALLAVLTSTAYLFKRIGLEAGHVQRNWHVRFVPIADIMPNVFG